jgi:hypothetical protein
VDRQGGCCSGAALGRRGAAVARHSSSSCLSCSASPPVLRNCCHLLRADGVPLLRVLPAGLPEPRSTHPQLHWVRSGDRLACVAAAISMHLDLLCSKRYTPHALTRAACLTTRLHASPPPSTGLSQVHRQPPAPAAAAQWRNHIRGLAHQAVRSPPLCLAQRMSA